MIAIRTIVCNINDEERLIAGLINCLLNSTGRKKYPWIQARSDGIYCAYCSHSHASTRNKSGKFVKVALTGNRPDKLAKHNSSVTHQNCASDYREFQARESSSSSIAQIIDQSNT